MSTPVNKDPVWNALLTAAGNLHVGICIDSACSPGMCAERSATARMLTCGACREFLMELDVANRELEILLGGGWVLQLKTPLPDCWGTAFRD